MVQINLNITKRRFFVLFGAILLLAGAFAVYAFGTSNPSNFGHDVGEIDFTSLINSLNIDGSLSVSVIPRVQTNLATVCIDHKPGLVYEVDGKGEARVYASGASPSGNFFWNCGGDPGKGNENAGKVLFAKWNWHNIHNVPKKAKITLLRGDVRDGLPVSLIEVIYTPDTPDNTRTLGGDVFGAPGAQRPNDIWMVIVWEDDPGLVSAPYTFLK